MEIICLEEGCNLFVEFQCSCKDKNRLCREHFFSHFDKAKCDSSFIGSEISNHKETIKNVKKIMEKAREHMITTAMLWTSSIEKVLFLHLKGYESDISKLKKSINYFEELKSKYENIGFEIKVMKCFRNELEKIINLQENISNKKLQSISSAKEAKNSNEITEIQSPSSNVDINLSSNIQEKTPVLDEIPKKLSSDLEEKKAADNYAPCDIPYNFPSMKLMEKIAFLKKLLVNFPIKCIKAIKLSNDKNYVFICNSYADCNEH